MLTSRLAGPERCRKARRIASALACLVVFHVPAAVAARELEPPLMTIVPRSGDVAVGRFQTGPASGTADAAQDKAGRVATGSFLRVVTVPGEEDSRSIPLSNILRLEFPSRMPETDPGHWQRIIRLPTGESFAGRIEAVPSGDGIIELRFAGQALPVPERVLDAMELMPGTRDMLLEPVLDRPGPATFELPDVNGSLLLTGRLQMRERPGDGDRREIFALLFRQSGQAHVLRVFLRSQQLECDVSNGLRLWRQTIPVRDASLTFRIERHSGLMVEFNQTVLAQLDMALPLQSLNLQFTDAGRLSAPIEVRVTDRDHPGRLSRAGASADQDRLLLNDGLEYYGSGLRLLDSGVRMEGPPELNLPWAEVRSARRARQSLAGAIARGWPVRIVLNPDRSCPGGELEPHWLRGMLSETQARGIVMEHSLLGRVTIPWALIQRMESEGDSAETSRLLLEAAVQHVGTAIRPEFQRVEPDGPAWHRSFDLPVDSPLLRAGQTLFLTLDTSGLEPSHPDTLQVSPHLNELRAGFLISEVIINESGAGTLNEHLRFHHRDGDFHRLRLRVPPGCLRPGINTLTIQQQPGRDSIDSFDDGELRGLALESQPAPAAEADVR